MVAYTRREHILNLPQMAFNGLSEHWLFKELGDMHWAMICNGLKVKLKHIVDSVDNRLYPSFVRIRYESSLPLNLYGENKHLDMKGKIACFGSKIFLSDIEINCAGIKNNATLMTVFVTKTGNNKSLTNTSPIKGEASNIHSLPVLPVFGSDYFKIKSGFANLTELDLQEKYRLANEKFHFKKQNIFETEYTLNPFYDLNGFNLLYFASYPQIHNKCERDYFNQLGEQFKINDDWAFSVSTIARDVFYFGNCDLKEKIVFMIDSVEYINDFKLKIISSLYRKSDNQLIAYIFTIKQLVNGLNPPPQKKNK